MAACLGTDHTLLSDLWIDAPDALEELERRVASGRIRSEDAPGIEKFIRDGYCVVDLDLPDSVFEEIERDVDGFWAEPPPNLAYGGTVLGQTGVFAFADARPWAHRRARRQHRFCCAHSHSQAMQRLYLNEDLHRYVSTIFGEPCIATQTLYFEYGSVQGMHRDTCVVTFDPPSHLAAAWIALEDVDPDCGPLEYIPGSHRLPQHVFDDGSVVYDRDRHGDRGMADMHVALLEQAAACGLEVEKFTPRRGQALLWHHSLCHGGSRVEQLDLTRKSLVVHYTLRRTAQGRDELIGYRRPGKPGFEFAETSTLETIGSDAALGYASSIADERFRGDPDQPADASRFRKIFGGR